MAITTLRQALEEKALIHAEMDERVDQKYRARMEEQARIADILAANPHIGVLNGGKYYVIENGVTRIETDPAKLVGGAA